MTKACFKMVHHHNLTVELTHPYQILFLFFENRITFFKLLSNLTLSVKDIGPTKKINTMYYILGIIIRLDLKKATRE